MLAGPVWFASCSNHADTTHDVAWRRVIRHLESRNPLHRSFVFVCARLMARARAINLAAGAAALPLEVLERASAEFVETDHSGMSFLAWASTDVTPLLSHFVFPWHPSWEVSLKWAIAPSRFIKSWSVRKAPSESFSASPTRTRSHATCMATQQIAFAIDVGALLQRRRHTPVLCHSSQPARQTGKAVICAFCSCTVWIT